MSQFSSMSHPMQSYALPNRKRANPAGGSHARSTRSKSAPRRTISKFASKKTRAPSTRSIKAIVSKVLDARLEQKHYTETENNWTVAQLDEDDSGHHLFNIIYPSQGVTDGARIGERIRLLKLDFNFSYNQQSSAGAQNDVNLTHFIVGFSGNDPTTNVADFLDANAFIMSANAGELIYDRCSMRNQDFLPNVHVLGSFKTLIAKRTTIFGATDTKQQNKMDQFSVDVNKTIMFSDTTLTSSNYKIAVITVADYGNLNISNASQLVGVPQASTSTGVRVFCSYRVTFTDA